MAKCGNTALRRRVKWGNDLHTLQIQSIKRNLTWVKWCCVNSGMLGRFGAAWDDILSPRDRAEWRICTREVTTTEKPRLQQTCFQHPVTVWTLCLSSSAISVTPKWQLCYTLGPSAALAPFIHIFSFVCTDQGSRCRSVHAAIEAFLLTCFISDPKMFRVKAGFLCL